MSRGERTMRLCDYPDWWLRCHPETVGMTGLQTKKLSEDMIGHRFYGIDSCNQSEYLSPHCE